MKCFLFLFVVVCSERGLLFFYRSKGSSTISTACVHVLEPECFHVTSNDFVPYSQKIANEQNYLSTCHILSNKLSVMLFYPSRQFISNQQDLA